MSTSPRKPPAPGAIVAGGAVLLLIAIVGIVLLSPAGSALYPPPPATAQAREISQLYDIIFAIAVVVFLVVEGLIVWSIFRYRRRPGDTDLPPQTHGNNLVEALWTLIPTVLVIFMFAISWQTLDHVDAVSADPDVHINALAGQFQWQFQYLDKDGNVLATQRRAVGDGGGMAVPVAKSVYVTLESRDVIHAWYVPRFLFKRDVVPGQQNHFEFKVDEAEAGQTFHGQCAELCGTGHRAMLFDVVAMAPADYDAWLAKLVEAANATPPPAPSGAAVIDLAAQAIAYDKKTLDAPADAPFVIAFKNGDPETITHDVDIKGADGAVIANQEPIAGGTTGQYQYQPLAAGTYQFFCSIHPGVAAMEGTLTVK
ncbi:MAG TPA: cytochrome c oxidase subunit II [Candidatus Limnocylindria bacterium]|nr:cytochrome c oxidase subunit II [Candidatus Limnocylindria bacterium]